LGNIGGIAPEGPIPGEFFLELREKRPQRQKAISICCAASYVYRAYGSRLSSVAVPEALGLEENPKHPPIIYP
jgi:hypothetical protein